MPESEITCPCCGSRDCGPRGPYVTLNGDKYQHGYGCLQCGVTAITIVSLREAVTRFTRRPPVKQFGEVISSSIEVMVDEWFCLNCKRVDCIDHMKCPGCGSRCGYKKRSGVQ